MRSIARVVFASAAFCSLVVVPAMAQMRGGGGFHGGMMGGGFHGGMMGPHGFHAGRFHGAHFHNGHFHHGHFHGHGFFPWWGFAPFFYGAYAYPYPYPAYPYPYPYYAGYAPAYY
jgi:hypothetical protein